MDQEALLRRLKEKLAGLVEEVLSSPNPPRTIQEIEALVVALGERVRQEIAQELAEATCTEAAAESGCKQVVSQRLKGAGMRWREASADHCPTALPAVRAAVGGVSRLLATAGCVTHSRTTFLTYTPGFLRTGHL